MPTEKTLAIIKPGAVRRGFSPSVLKTIKQEKYGLTVLGQRFVNFSKRDAESFYIEHQAQPFYGGLVAHTCSGPCIVLILEAEDMVKKWRQLMGPTDPATAKNQITDGRDTLRGLYYLQHPEIKMPDNAVHGSDSLMSAEREITFVLRSGLI